MVACHWCGETHPPDRLCARAQRGMTRRSFCFLFGAGVAGLALAGRSERWVEVAVMEPWHLDQARLGHNTWIASGDVLAVDSAWILDGPKMELGVVTRLGF